MKKFFLFLLVLSLSGCGEGIIEKTSDPALAFFSAPKNIEQREKEYQVSAPWDIDMYDLFYERKKEVPKDMGRIYGGIIPHHLLAGYMDATFFDALSGQNPSTIVIFGPNHFSRGTSPVISTARDWKTVYGIVPTNFDFVKKLGERGLLSVDEDVVAEEHSIYSLIPFVRKSLPQTKVLPLILQGDITESEMNDFSLQLQKLLPEDTVYLASIDFSHYQSLPVASFHDELSHGVIRSFDFDRLDRLEIDSVPSLYMLLRMMEKADAQKIGFELHENAATLTGSLVTKETTSYYSPYFVKGKANMKKTVSFLHVGDLMLGREVESQMKKYGDDFVYVQLDNKEQRFWKGYDVGIANLEGPFANYRRPTSKSIAFRFDPRHIPGLADRNFRLVTLANNHSLDMGRDAFEESKENLKNAGIEYFGAGYGLLDGTVYTKEIGGLRFAFIGLNDTYFSLNLDEITKMVQDLEKSADHIIASVHWGSEYKLLASGKRQQEMAHALVDAGVDVVIGHHPHVVQEMEIYRDRPIFYSLGNFIFDQYWSEPTQEGLAVGLVFHDTDAISSYLLFNKSKNSQVSLTEYKKATGVLSQFLEVSRLGENIFDKTHFKITTYLN